MLRTNIYLEEKQVSFLKEQGLTLAEHIRRAIDKYVQELKGLNVSASQSKKEGE